MATLKDVANQAQVSITTVSRFLNNDPGLILPDSTREAILHAVETLHYVKKPKKDKSAFTMGILQWYSLEQELNDPYYLSIRMGVESYCKKEHMQIIRVLQSDANSLDSLKEVDGLICIGKFSSQETDDFAGLCPHIIFLDMKSKRIRYPSVSLDFNQALKDAIDYLHALNHQTIGFLGGEEYVDENTKYPDERLEIFKHYCDAYDMHYQDHLYITQYTKEAGYTMMNSLLERPSHPTAVFCASDPLAIGAMRALKEKNIKVPEEMSIIGFDDIEDAFYSTPPLTTLHAPAKEMGYLGAKMIHKMLSDDDLTPMQIVLPCTLMERESCKKI